MTVIPPSDHRDPELDVLLEAARRATWDAIHGPRHLRSGRFRPVADDSSEFLEATQLHNAAEDASRRS
jgi:hypothetical protein